jgi:hypothetical protein
LEKTLWQHIDKLADAVAPAEPEGLLAHVHSLVCRVEI